MVLFPPPFYFVFYISNLLSYIQNNFSYELARPIMGTIFLVIVLLIALCKYWDKVVALLSFLQGQLAVDYDILNGD